MTVLEMMRKESRWLPREISIFGSGSSGYFCLVVLVNEYFDGVFVHTLTLGKGECLSDEPSHSLAQGIIAPLNVVGAPSFVAAVMLRGWNHLSISLPQIGIADAFFVTCRNCVPQDTTRLFASTAQSVSHDLSRATT